MKTIPFYATQEQVTVLQTQLTDILAQTQELQLQAKAIANQVKRTKRLLGMQEKSPTPIQPTPTKKEPQSLLQKTLNALQSHPEEWLTARTIMQNSRFLRHLGIAGIRNLLNEMVKLGYARCMEQDNKTMYMFVSIEPTPIVYPEYSEEDKNARAFILGLARNEKPRVNITSTSYGKWLQCCVTLQQAHDASPNAFSGILKSFINGRVFPGLAELLPEM